MLCLSGKKAAAVFLLIAALTLSVRGNFQVENTDSTTTNSTDAFARPNIAYSEIIYTRPDTAELTERFLRLAKKLTDGTEDYYTLIEELKNVTDEYASFDTMYTYLHIELSKDLHNAALVEEYRALSAASPIISRAAENMMISAASSSYAELLERDFFGAGFTEEYNKRIPSSERALNLLTKEALLEAEYTTLTDNKEQALDIFIELVKTRRNLADELGYESYTEYAYANMNRDYSPSQMLSLINEISEHIVPLYQKWAALFSTVGATPVSAKSMVENLPLIYEKSGHKSLCEPYSFMLKNGFYDISPKTQGRAGGAYTTYLQRYSAPFIFMSCEGYINDYMTLAHEYGHFLDFYNNGCDGASLDLLEVSSQALELLTLSMLDGEITDENYRSVALKESESSILTLITQAFFASIEHKLYSTENESLTPGGIKMIVSESADELGMPYFSNLPPEAILIDHIVLYPHYVQSYCSSLAVALNIFFMEENNSDDGLLTYLKLIGRTPAESFNSAISRVELDSPFRCGAIRDLSEHLNDFILKNI